MKLLHFSTVDVDPEQVAGIGAIPMPTGPARVRLFLNGGGVIDLQESREAARDIWLERESAEHRTSRLVQENMRLRSLYDSVAVALSTAVEASPRDDMWRALNTIRNALELARADLAALKSE